MWPFRKWQCPHSPASSSRLSNSVFWIRMSVCLHQVLVFEVSHCVLLCELLCCNAAVELAGIVRQARAFVVMECCSSGCLCCIFTADALWLPAHSPSLPSRPLLLFLFFSERQKTDIDKTTPQAWVNHPQAWVRVPILLSSSHSASFAPALESVGCSNVTVFR